MATYLDRILFAHRARAAADDRDLAALVAEAAGLPPARGFRDALAGVSGLGVIAEFKRASPSRGILGGARDPATVGAAYAAGGATCLSVLTDAEFFSGSPSDLIAARQASGLPVLRKDFTVGPRDVCDARLMGADAVLLIAAALDDGALAACARTAAEVGIDALVEVHDEAEAARASAVGADLVGVNQRDLVSFAVDTERAARVAPAIGDGVIRVAESGIAGPDDAARLAGAGYHAVLVGEALVTSDDPGAGVAAMRGAIRGTAPPVP